LWTAHGRPGAQVDRLLNGPTHDAWLTPWRAYLQRLGVQFQLQSRATRLYLRDGWITGVRVERPEGGSDVAADFYVAAVPVERMVPLVSPGMMEADPSLAQLGKLRTEWMNGIQFFLGEDVPIVNGHLALIDAPWALTAIAQKQFWPHTDLAGFGDGRVRDVLSVVVSNWDAPGMFIPKPARLCSREEILAEVWMQLKAHVNRRGRPTLRDAALVDWSLADSIEHRADGTVVNHEPLLINTAGSWRYRPEAVTRLPNLFLAADYVRTTTDIATMEAANEAARRAVNGILAASGAATTPCRIWDLEEPAVFKPLQLLDRRRLERGLPHLLAGPPS
ncbi:MAG: FAD-dependent oxidoreductase, partial [Chloroflexota bacterium]